jgi:cysteine synthase A
LQGGLGNSLLPKNLDRRLVDEVHWLNDREAFTATRALAMEQKMFCGNTSGSVYRVLTSLAATAAEGSRLVGIFPDRGDRYVGTVYDDRFWAERGITGQRLADRPRQVVPRIPVRSWSYLVTAPGGEPPAFVFVESNTTGSGMQALAAARRLGFLPVLATNDPSRYRGLAEADCHVVRCDTDHPAALYAAVTAARPAERVGGVSTTSEFYVVAAAALARRLGLPAERRRVLAGCRDKSTLRRKLARAGVRQPRFEVAADPAAAVAAAERIGLPCVVKPVDDSGSTRVLLCTDPAQVAGHATEILGRTRNVRGQPVARLVLVEEYLSGPELSVEMFGLDGEQVLLGVVEKSVVGRPNFVEWRHILPADLAPAAGREVVGLVRRALAAVGMRHGPSHTEVKLGAAGAAIVEINPRLAGGMIPELIRLTTGVDPLESQLRAAAGMAPLLPTGADGYAGIQFLLPPGPGVLEWVAGQPAATAVEGVEQVVLTAVPGRRLTAPRDAYDRIGYVIARGASRAAVAESLRRSAGFIQLRVREEVTAT